MLKSIKEVDEKLENSCNNTIENFRTTNESL